jgi:hypothetical protein
MSKVFGYDPKDIRKSRSRVVRHPPRYRGSPRLYEVEGLTHAEALHWLMHHPKG